VDCSICCCKGNEMQVCAALDRCLASDLGYRIWQTSPNLSKGLPRDTLAAVWFDLLRQISPRQAMQLNGCLAGAKMTLVRRHPRQHVLDRLSIPF